MKLSIIVPTYNEGNNVKTLTAHIIKVMEAENHNYEIIYVDASTDQTPLN